MLQLSVIILAAVVSLDGLIAAVAYGAKRIALPLRERVVIAISSALTIWLSLLLGGIITRFVDQSYTRFIGAAILVVLGGLLIVRTKLQVSQRYWQSHNTNKELMEIKLRPLGIIVQILKDPEIADVDHSGRITIDEAVFLGVALALDAFGAGLGAGLAGMPYWPLVFCVGLFKLSFLSIGVRWGEHLAQIWPGVENSSLPGLVLIALGVFTMI